MIAQMIDAALVVWFALTGLSVAYVAWDSFTRNPELTVMKYGWVLVTLYTGPVGAALYVLSCEEPGPYQHEVFIEPLWKQALGSTIHCLAGDATGIIIAAAVTAALALPMWLDLIFEYLLGFGFGLLIFQALFMRDMLGGSYRAALVRSFMPEWLSMNAVMAGMIPVMVALMNHDMRAMEVTSIRFWGVMSLATLVGAVIAYPVNVWLVAVGLKHGMGTVRVLGAGGHNLEAEATRIPATSGEQPLGLTAAMVGHAMTTAQHAPRDREPAEHERMAMKGGATGPQLAAVTLLTLLALGAGVVLAGLSGGLSMAPTMESMPMPLALRASSCEDAA
jgi:Domain of unknown function (DUF4396)